MFSQFIYINKGQGSVHSLVLSRSGPQRVIPALILHPDSSHCGSEQADLRDYLKRSLLISRNGNRVIVNRRHYRYAWQQCDSASGFNAGKQDGGRASECITNPPA
jgi:hypothetical protein